MLPHAPSACKHTNPLCVQGFYCNLCVSVLRSRTTEISVVSHCFIEIWGAQSSHSGSAPPLPPLVRSMFTQYGVASWSCQSGAGGDSGRPLERWAKAEEVRPLTSEPELRLRPRRGQRSKGEGGGDVWPALTFVLLFWGHRSQDKHVNRDLWAFYTWYELLFTIIFLSSQTFMTITSYLYCMLV